MRLNIRLMGALFGILMLALIGRRVLYGARFTRSSKDSGAGAILLILFILANIGVNGSFVFYDSLLPHVSAPEEMDRVATAGYALGFLLQRTARTRRFWWLSPD